MGVLAGLLAVAFESSDFQGEICEYNQATKHEDCTTYSLFPFLLIKVFDTLNYYGVAITALATVFIGVFTLTLKLSTDNLWMAAKDQIAAAENAAKMQSRDMQASIAVADKAANAAKQSADVAKQTLIAAQRAWIKAKIDIGNIPLVFDQNGASTTVSFEITNVGNAPAINVTSHAWLIVGKQRQFPLAEQQRRFDEIRRQPFMFGFTLFPGENFPGAIGIGLWTVQVNVTRDEIDEGFRLTNGAYISLYVIGCIDYTFPIDADMHHQTTFMLELRKTLPDIFIRPDDGQIPPSSLTLTDFNFGLGRHAD